MATSCSSDIAHYQLKRGRSRDALVRDADSGLGILRTAPRRAARGSHRAHRAARAKAREARPAGAHQGQHHLDRASRELPRLRRRKDIRRRPAMVNGEHRFLGLWTSSAYHSSPADIPLLRRKLEAVIEHFGLPPQSHDAKAVVNVIENFPRDELFQMPRPELIAIVRGIVNLYERRRVRLFARRDSYEPLLLMPGVRAARSLQHRGARAHRTHRPRSASAHGRRDRRCRSPTRRWRACTCWCARGRARRRVENIAGIEAEMAAAAATWEDRLQAELDRARRGPRCGGPRRPLREGMFPPAYRVEVEPAQALEDIEDLEALAADPARSAAQPASAAGRPGKSRAPAHPAHRVG